MSRSDSVTAQFKSTVQERLAEARQRADRFAKAPSGSSGGSSGGSSAASNDWLTVAQEFDAILHPLDAVRGRIELYASVDPDKAMRQLGEELELELVAFTTELSLSRPIFDRLHAIEDAMQEGASGEPEAARLVTEALRDFRRGGVDKDEATRSRVQALSQEIVEIGQDFDRRIAQDTRNIEIDAADAAEALAGMPEDWIRARPAGDDGKIRITTDPQDLLPFMMYADRGDLRRELYRARISRGMPENLDLLGKMVDARAELAALLGFDSYAAFDLDDKMARSPGTVRSLLERCSKIARPKAETELGELSAVKKRLGLENPGTIYVWERSYLTEKFKEERFGLDSQCVRPYLAFERVRDGLMKTSEELFGVEFKPAPHVETWHEDVQAFEVFEEGKLTARFFLDLHPREAKYKHAAVFPLQAGVAGDGAVPEASMVCNFEKPSPGESAYMLHDQVTTFFHEFGHLLHHLFGGSQRFLAFSGLETEMDFVEVPSQMYEEWAWDSGVLAKFAHHEETGEPIPADLVDTLRRAEEWGKGLQFGVQIFYAMVSLEMHSRASVQSGGTPWSAATLQEFERELQAEWSPFPYEEGTSFLASFGHLNGYAAAYYTYLWSLVIAKDLFGSFGENLMDRSTAERYRKEVIGRGGSREANELVRAFLGRDYAHDAFEKYLKA